MYIIGILLIGFLTTLILMPINFKICHKLKLIDNPNERKVHTNIKLRGGGISVYLAFFICLIFIYSYTLKLEILGVIISSLLLFITGLLDDKFSLNAKLKLLLQISSASIVYFFGVKITNINIFDIHLYFSNIVSFSVTIFWIVLLINAINLIDGLDGLASGVSIIILTTLCIFSNDTLTSNISLIVIGSLICFLKFNFYPSKIFLGDTGSMFLGYIISVLSIMGLGKTVVGVSTILIMVSFPLLDVGLAIIRRLMNKQPIFSPDKNHIHHCLLNKGLSHKGSVLVIYIINIFFAIISLLTFYLSSTIWISIILFITYIIFTIILINYLKVLPIKLKMIK